LARIFPAQPHTIKVSEVTLHADGKMLPDREQHAADDCRVRTGGAGNFAAVYMHTMLGLAGTAGRGAHGGGRAAVKTEQGVEVKSMSVKMICIRAPKFLSGILKLLTRRRG